MELKIAFKLEVEIGENVLECKNFRFQERITDIELRKVEEFNNL